MTGGSCSGVWGPQTQRILSWVHGPPEETGNLTMEKAKVFRFSWAPWLKRTKCLPRAESWLIPTQPQSLAEAWTHRGGSACTEQIQKYQLTNIYPKTIYIRTLQILFIMKGKLWRPRVVLLFFKWSLDCNISKTRHLLSNWYCQNISQSFCLYF